MTIKDIPLDDIFSALADPTRRAILARLAKGQATVSDLAAPFDISLPAVSKHLRVLERAGLLNRTVSGRVHHCRLNPEPLKEATNWLAGYSPFWEEGPTALAEQELEATNEPA